MAVRDVFLSGVPIHFSQRQIWWNFGGLILLAIGLAIFTTRGRMGSDDLEVYALAKQYPLIGGAFFELLANSSVSTIPHRWLWLVIDHLVISAVTLLGLPRILGYDFDYLACSMLPAVAMWLAFLLLNQRQRCMSSPRLTQGTFALDPVVVLLFFGTVMIHFFNGSSVESYITLLLVIRLVLDRAESPWRCLVVDVLLVGFKPYYAIVVLGLLLHRSTLRGRILKIGVYLAACLALPLGIQSFFALRGFSYRGLPWDITLISMAEHLYAMNFGLGFGLLWCYLPVIILIALGAKPTRSFLIRCAVVVGLQVFLSTLPYWHGGAPGNRYLSPLLVLFIDEMRIGWLRVVAWHWRLAAAAGMLSVLVALPVLEYKNIAYKEYLSGAVLSGKPHGYQDTNREFFPLDSLTFNPLVFAGSVMVLKTFSGPDAALVVGPNQIPVDLIYPGTLPARLDFLSKLDSRQSLLPAQVSDKLAALGFVGRLLSGFFYGALIVLFAWTFWRHARRGAMHLRRGA